jgi:hypothetical protein
MQLEEGSGELELDQRCSENDGDSFDKSVAATEHAC